MFFYIFNGKIVLSSAVSPSALLPAVYLFIYLFIYLFKFENDVFFMAQAYSAEKENKSTPITNRT